VFAGLFGSDDLGLGSMFSRHDYGRLPKPGEHLGEYLIAERLPSQTLPVRPFRMGRFLYLECDLPRPKLGDLPPKPGECLGEYAIASELPPRYEIPPEPQRPTVTLLPPVPVPPAIEISSPFGLIGYGKTLPLVPKPGATARTSINFTSPVGMKVSWQLPDGSFNDDKDSLTTPKEYNFPRGQVYRLRVTGAIKDKPRVFYPTLEVPAATPKTATCLKHSSVPVSFTADDFAQAKQGFLVVKVIYLPDPSNEDFATVVSAEEVVSTRLEPGADPVAEAQRRGSVLAIIRLGNIDLENRVSPAPGGETGRIIPLPPR